MTPETDAGQPTREPAQSCFLQRLPQGSSPPALPSHRQLYPSSAFPPGHAVGKMRHEDRRDVSSPVASCFLFLASIFVISTPRLVFFRDAGRITEVEHESPSSPAHWPWYHLQPHFPFSSGLFLRLMWSVNLATTSTSLVLFAPQRKM